MALKPLVFQVLLALADGDRHGWSLVREIQQRGDFDAIMPGNFYRTLRGMMAEGLIEESAPKGKADADQRRRYFRLTAAGATAAAAEARRLEALVVESRAKKLLAKRG